MDRTQQDASTAARLGYASLRPSPALLVAICALVLALTGSAVALKGKNSVKSNDIAPGAVRPPDADLVKVDGGAGPFITDSGPAVDLPGSPAVTVKVGQGGLVGVYARGTGQINGGGNNALAQMHLFEPTMFSGSPRILQFDSATPELRVSTPGVGNVDGTATETRGGWVVFPVPQAGTYTFSLRYSQSGGGTAQFSNTGLWVEVFE
jgi:hypothetical protein